MTSEPKKKPASRPRGARASNAVVSAARARKKDRAGGGERGEPESKGPDAVARERILASAERLFLDFGYVRFTMDQLALDLGMSKKTLYKHYASKDELLGTVWDARAARLDAEIGGLIAEEHADFESKLVAFVELAVERFGEVSEPFLQDVRRSAPDLFRKIEGFREQAIPRHVESFLVKGAEAGVFRKDFPFGVVASVLMHAGQNMLLPKHGRAKLMMPPGQLVDIIVRIVCEGIIVRPRSPVTRAASRSRK
jgi:AcrR family transcriptional regulator